MAHKKQGGKASQHVSPAGKRLGIKRADGQGVKEGMIIMKQRGTLVHPGVGVRVGRDFTLFAVKSGIVKFGRKLGKKNVSVVSK